MVDRERRRDRQHPAGPETTHTATAATPSTCQTAPPKGCHSATTRTRQRSVARTYVARSSAAGTRRRSHALTGRRAITECWSANSPRSARSVRPRRPCRAARSVHGPRDHDVGEEGDRPQRDGGEPHPADGGEDQEAAASGHPHARPADGRRSRGTTALAGDVPGGHLGPRPEPEAQPDPLDVRLGRPLGDAEPLGQLPVGEAVGDQRRHLGLTGREARRHRPAQPGQPEESPTWSTTAWRRPSRAGATPLELHELGPGICSASTLPWRDRRRSVPAPVQDQGRALTRGRAARTSSS